MEIASQVFSTMGTEMALMAQHSSEHFMLRQQGVDAPKGEHHQHSITYKFPHKDADGKCWQPEGYDPVQDDDGTDAWLDYEDSVSEVMRAECDLQPWMSVCDIPLYWEPVKCNIYIKRAKEEAQAEAALVEPVPDWQKGMIPIYVIIPFQILSAIWKGLAIGIVALPWWLILASVATVDWFLDWVFLFTFGIFCRPCAGFFIWVLNIAFLPFTVWGWVMRLMLETYGLFIDGWMLPFGLSGCYLNWGHQCWFAKDRSLRTVLDIPLFNTLVPGGGSGIDGLKDTLLKLITPPALDKSSDILHVRRQNRKNLLAAIPIISEFQLLTDQVYQHIDF